MCVYIDVYDKHMAKLVPDDCFDCEKLEFYFNTAKRIGNNYLELQANA